MFDAFFPAVPNAPYRPHEIERPVLNLTTNADWMKQLPDVGRLFQLQSKAVVVNKDGTVVAGNPPDMSETVEKIAKMLRDVGVDEKSIEAATRTLKDTTQAISNAVADASVAKEEAMKGSGEVARALEQVRDALDKIRKQTEEAVKRDRERRQEQKQP